jgi:hypothetical protein
MMTHNEKLALVRLQVHCDQTELTVAQAINILRRAHAAKARALKEHRRALEEFRKYRDQHMEKIDA